MRIRELNLIRYGKFTDRPLDLPAREQDIHFIVGPNEAGKSTLRTAVGDWLFGIPARTSLAFLHPMQELKIGGVLEKTGKEAATLAFHRVKGNKNTLRSPDGQPLADNRLLPWLSGLDASAFQRMYALDHTSLVEGGAGILSASGDLGRLLFQSAAGLEQLGEVLQTLQAEADAQWGPRKSGSRAYYAAQEEFDGAKDTLRQTRLGSRDWKAQHDALAEGETRLQAARQQHADLQAQINRLQRRRRVEPILLSLADNEKQRATLLAEGPVPQLPEEAGQTLNQVLQEQPLVQSARAQHQKAFDEAQAAMATLTPDTALLAVADEIRALNERRLQYRAHRTDILACQAEIRLEESRLKEKAAALQWPPDWRDKREDIARHLPAQGVRDRLKHLLKGREALLNQCQQTEAALQRQEQLIATWQAEFQTMEAAPIEAGLALAVEQALTLGDTAAHQESQNLQWRQLSDGLNAAQAQLGRWSAPPETLAGMIPPASSILQHRLDERRNDQLEEKASRLAVSAKKAEIEQGRLEIEQLVRTFNPVSRAQVDAARGARDALWQTIHSQADRLPELAGAFEQSLRQADQLADERADRLQHDAERHTRALRLEGQAHELQTLQTQWQSILDRLQEKEAAWFALLETGGLPPLPIELAAHWLEQRQAVLEYSARLREFEQHRQAREQAVLAAREALAQYLPAQTLASPPPPLAVCLQQGQARLQAARQTQARRQFIEQQLRDARIEREGLAQAAQAANRAWQSWEAQWQDALSMAAYPASTFADRVEAELDIQTAIEQLLDKIHTLQTERVDRMQADLDDLEEAANTLAKHLNRSPGAAMPEEFIQQLAQNLAAAERTQAEGQQWQTRSAQAKAGLEQVAQQQARLLARLAPLRVQAGVGAEAPLEHLAQAVERARQRCMLESRATQLEAELAKAGDGLSREVLEAELAELEMPRVLEEIERLSRASEALLEEITDMSNRHGAQKAAFDRLTGAGEAAVAEERRQEAISRMAQSIEQYWEAHVASRLLRWSMERFRETRQGPLLTRASSSFNTLTLQSFHRLLVDGEASHPRLTGVREDGRQVEVAGMSEGSRDQLYLALRLAALDMQIDQGMVMPLIADDLFINFDDTRTAAGFKVLGELSRRTQVIFLTHHDHLVPLAKQVLGNDLNVLML